MTEEKKTVPTGFIPGNWDPPTEAEREQFFQRERKFRIGAAHATEAIASALEQALSLEDAQRIARTFANLVQDRRLREDGDFELSLLVGQALRDARQSPDDPG